MCIPLSHSGILIFVLLENHCRNISIKIGNNLLCCCCLYIEQRSLLSVVVVWRAPSTLNCLPSALLAEEDDNFKEDISTQ